MKNLTYFTVLHLFCVRVYSQGVRPMSLDILRDSASTRSQQLQRRRVYKWSCEIATSWILKP
ncbi:hypothetical protein [Candidatus Regiella insecticola]|uniref:hypothetical protein n=1 Tax=Candidatus Regiella insecticola TaxID=138073 RepID=UPI00159E1E02|nr:hypothetical protein [Candidatus Regiella insecticola]